MTWRCKKRFKLAGRRRGGKKALKEEEGEKMMNEQMARKA